MEEDYNQSETFTINLHPDKLAKHIKKWLEHYTARQGRQSWWLALVHGRPGSALGRIHLTIPGQFSLMPVGIAAGLATGIIGEVPEGIVTFAVLNIGSNSDGTVILHGVVTEVDPGQTLGTEDRTRLSLLYDAAGFRLAVPAGTNRAFHTHWQPRPSMTRQQMQEFVDEYR